MTDEANTKEVKVSGELPTEWAAKKLLGPTFGEIGEDLKSLYIAGRDKILDTAVRKTGDIEDGKQTNLRVARDVFWNGSFTDEAICAEYFGGILASSRSDEGRDDTGVFYTDIIKSLSSKQLHLHYIIYHALNLLFSDLPEEERNINVGKGTELHKKSVWFAAKELNEHMGINTGVALTALYNKGLIVEYTTDIHTLADSRTFTYAKISPTSLGIQLYANVHNRFDDWRNFSNEYFGQFPDIEIPQYHALSIEDLLAKIGIE